MRVEGYGEFIDVDNMFIQMFMHYSLFCIHLWISYGQNYEMLIKPQLIVTVTMVPVKELKSQIPKNELRSFSSS